MKAEGTMEEGIMEEGIMEGGSIGEGRLFSVVVIAMAKGAEEEHPALRKDGRERATMNRQAITAHAHTLL